jgi:hypothetical protein
VTTITPDLSAKAEKRVADKSLGADRLIAPGNREPKSGIDVNE